MVWLALLLASVWSGYTVHDQLPHLFEMPQSYFALFETGFFSDGYHVPVILLLSSLPAVLELHQDICNGYLKMSAARAGVSSYFSAWSKGIAFSSFIQAFSGLICYNLFLLLLALYYRLPLYDPAADAIMTGIPQKPVISVLLQCLTFSMGASVWAAIACLTLAITTDLFIALSIPLTLYVALMLLMNMGIRANISGYLIVFGQYRFALRVLRSCGMSVGLTGIILFVTMCILAEKRMS